MNRRKLENKEFKKRKGFTLLEVIVVIAVIALVIPAVYAIVFSILKQQVTIYKITEEKRQADNTLNILQTALRPAVGVYSAPDDTTQVCINGRYPTVGYSHGNDLQNPMYFKDKQGNFLQFYINNVDNKFMYKIIGGSITSNAVTNSKVTVSAFNIACEKNTTFSPAILVLSYTVVYTSTQPVGSGTPDILPLTYRSRIVLRNN